MKYVAVIPFVYKPYFEDFKATLKIPEDNCLFVDNTVSNIGIMRAHNMGIDFMRERGADWLIVMSAGIRFGAPGGLDFLELLEAHKDLLVINGAGRVTFEGEAEQVIAMGYHLTAFSSTLIEAIGRWDENFTPYGFDDIDMMLRMKKYFGNQLKADTFPVDMEHVSRSHSISLAGVVSPSGPLIAYFVEKWGRHPGSYEWDGYPRPFRDETKGIDWWPPAPNGGFYDERIAINR